METSTVLKNNPSFPSLSTCLFFHFFPPLFPVYEDVEPEAGEDRVLELGILVHDDGDDAHVGQEATRPTHHVLAGQPVLR